MKNNRHAIFIVICIAFLVLIVAYGLICIINSADHVEQEGAPTAVKEKLIQSSGIQKAFADDEAACDETATDTSNDLDVTEFGIIEPSATEPAVTELTVPVLTVPTPKLWDENVELTAFYHKKDETFMSYLLYTPNNIQDGQKVPLLIWMHGSGETNADEENLRSTGLPGILESMEVQPNAFVLCPQLNGSRNYTYWHTEDTLSNVIALIEYIIAANPAIDTDNISIAGHSLGAIGCLRVAQRLPYIKRVACLSPYEPEIELTLESTSVKLYVGNEWYGEDGFCVTMAKKLSALYGYAVYSFDCSHGALPGLVFAANEETGVYDTFNWLLINDESWKTMELQ